MKTITGISIARDGIGNTKSPTFLIHVLPNIIEPIAYIRKPKHITDEQFKAIVADIAGQIKGLSIETAELLQRESDGRDAR